MATPRTKTAEDSHERPRRPGEIARPAARRAARDGHLPGDDRAAPGRPRQVRPGPQQGRRRRIRPSRSSPSARPTARTSPTRPSSTSVGTLAKIAQVVQLQDGTVRAIVQGQQRLRLLGFESDRPFISARVEMLTTSSPRASRSRRWCAPSRARSSSTSSRARRCRRRRPSPRATSPSPGLLADMVAYSPDMTTEQRQELLETIDVIERLKLVSASSPARSRSSSSRARSSPRSSPRWTRPSASTSCASS